MNLPIPDPIRLQATPGDSRRVSSAPEQPPLSAPGPWISGYGPRLSHNGFMSNPALDLPATRKLRSEGAGFDIKGVVRVRVRKWGPGAGSGGGSGAPLSSIRDWTEVFNF
ncbi:MAG: hypothetical protein AAGJ81_14255 [Verrucomicrobiota bacterium]